MNDIEAIAVPGMFQSGSPYAQAIRTGRFVFVSGCVPVDPVTGAVVVGAMRAQTVAVLSNIRAILAEAGADLSRVVKTTVFLTDFADFGEMNEAYRTAFGEHLPARSTVEVAALAKAEYRLEIEAIAVLP